MPHPKSIIAFMFVATLLFTGCEKNNEVDTTIPDKPITDAIALNLKYAQAEDADKYMLTIHPKTNGYSQVKAMMQQLFTMYDVKYDLEKTEIIKKTATEAKVRITQTTIKVSGPAFQNNRLTAIHTLRKHNGQWKFFSTEPEDIEHLD